eukprot:scaffold789_cov125-Isochrysis_galbana.AAC.1
MMLYRIGYSPLRIPRPRRLAAEEGVPVRHKGEKVVECLGVCTQPPEGLGGACFRGRVHGCHRRGGVDAEEHDERKPDSARDGQHAVRVLPTGGEEKGLAAAGGDALGGTGLALGEQGRSR